MCSHSHSSPWCGGSSVISVCWPLRTESTFRCATLTSRDILSRTRFAPTSCHVHQPPLCGYIVVAWAMSVCACGRDTLIWFVEKPEIKLKVYGNRKSECKGKVKLLTHVERMYVRLFKCEILHLSVFHSFSFSFRLPLRSPIYLIICFAASAFHSQLMLWICRKKTCTKKTCVFLKNQKRRRMTVVPSYYCLLFYYYNPVVVSDVVSF